MKIRAYLSHITTVCFIISSMVFSGFLTANQESVNRKEIEKYLKKAKVSESRSSGTRTRSYWVDLDDGRIKRSGFLKYTHKPRPTIAPDSYKYGLAAYVMDKLLDLNIIPPSVEREINGEKASLQLAVEVMINEAGRRLNKIEPPDSENFYNALEEIKVFEYLVYSDSLCKEADLPDILITPQWKVWRVDFSEAFEPSPELIQGCQITRCSRKMYQNLMKLEDKAIRSKVKKYLNKEEINAVLKRKKLIIEKIDALIKEKGEEKVLF